MAPTRADEDFGRRRADLLRDRRPRGPRESTFREGVDRLRIQEHRPPGPTSTPFSADIIRARDAFVGGEPGAGNLIDDPVQVTRPDGTTGPWHPGLNTRTLDDECGALRAACYIFVAAMSMMRYSENRWGAPATETFRALRAALSMDGELGEKARETYFALLMPRRSAD